MENKLNQPALEEYAKEYADLLMEKLFSNKESISGKQIIEEIPVNQVALFTLFNLFKLWKSEMLQLKSPYFDYESEEVKLKLKELMNALSRNINVSKEDFNSILVKGVYDTLLLIISPLSYYKTLVAAYKSTAPNMDEVKDLQRFIKINSHMRDALLAAWASNYSGNELFNIAFNNLDESPADVAPLLNPFNELLPLNMTKIWIEEETIKEPVDVLIDKLSNGMIEEDSEIKEAKFNTIHTQFKEEKTTILADSLGFDSTQSSFKSMLTINQKFMFVNDLFDGNKEDFTKVIDFLDTCATKEVVIKFIESNYIQRGSWKSEAPQVKDFFALIDRKFG